MQVTRMVVSFPLMVRRVSGPGLRGLHGARGPSALIRGRVVCLRTSRLDHGVRARRRFCNRPRVRQRGDPADPSEMPPLPPRPSPWRHPIRYIVRVFRDNKERMMQLWRQFGYLTLIVYFGLYVIVLTGLWGLIGFGIIRGPNVNKWLNNSDWKKRFTDKEIIVPDSLQSFLTAWLMTKTTEPVRMVLTILLVPALVRYLPQSWKKVLRVRADKFAAAAASRMTRRGKEHAADGTARGHPERPGAHPAPRTQWEERKQAPMSKKRDGSGSDTER